jgi:class 3 adenylate cyclase
MDVSDWLRGLGLERYDSAFRDNDIDADVLSRLTADDLDALGVSSVGHRRRLLDAIAALRRGTPALPPTDEAEPAAASAATPRSEAERRQLTVMFVDLVNSTALASRFDPEDLREIVAAYHRCVDRVVEGFEGYVAKYLGDGVLVYFGYPRAHEDEAERAVRAGLELAEAVKSLPLRDKLSLQVRIGIATGLVVVGDLLGEGSAREEAVVGETPNLAARLQTLAAPGAVVIALGTRRLLGELFDLADLGARSLKGFEAPVKAWRVLGAGTAEDRFAARRAAELTPLVGREEELALLLHRWELAKGGEGQAVLLSGEPGIGKSRLFRALRERLTGEPHLDLHYQCSPYHISSALHPVIEQLERSAGFERADPPDARRGKLENLLARSGADIPAAGPVLGEMLSIPSGDRYPALDLPAQRLKEATLQALLDLLAGFAAQGPVLMSAEDAHWIDPTTEEFVRLAVERARDLPMLVVITCRPDYVSPWAGDARVAALALTRLGRQQVAMLVERVTGGRDLPEEVAEQIAAKTDGVPLYVEELTKAMLESDLLRQEDDRFVLAGPLPPLAVPTSLQDSLMARLDRLAPVRQVAQIGAAIGREFAYELLEAVAPPVDGGLQAALERLAEAGLVFRRGSPPRAIYTFKHALVQDAAYASLLRSRRQQLHARIATAIAEQFPEIAENQPEVLARHHAEAGMLRAAVACLRSAAERASARYAHREAIAHATSAIAFVRQLPEAAWSAEQELALQLIRAESGLIAAGYGAAEVGEAYDRAAELSSRVGDTGGLFRVLDGYWVHHVVHGEVQRGYDVGLRLRSLAEAAGDPDWAIFANQALGISSLFLGVFPRAHDHLHEAVALQPRAGDLSRSRRGGEPQAICMIMDALALWFLGRPDAALAQSGEALRRSDDLRHPYTQALVRVHVATLRYLRREPLEMIAAAEEAIAFSDEHGFDYLSSLAATRLAAARILDDPAVGVEHVRHRLDAYRAGRNLLHVPGLLLQLAEALLAKGEVQESERALLEAEAMVSACTVRWCVAEVNRVFAGLLHARGRVDEAEVRIGTALRLAREQRARSLELRVATDMATALRCRMGAPEAREALAAIYGWFTEGHETPDLKAAKVALGELS